MRSSMLGVTLIEMLVVTILLGASLSLAVPSFNSMTGRNQSATQINEIITAINLARSEATKIGSVVSMRAAAPTTDNELGGGWCVAAGTPTDCTGALIRAFPALQGNTTLNVVPNADALQFNAYGELVGGAELSLIFCSATKKRKLTISPVGRTRIEDANALACT
jgi:type IV fimbrial biogenesis protein FimT